MNHIDRGTKALKFGDHPVRLSSIQEVAKKFPAAEHNLRATDYQANRNRQSVPILEHLTATVSEALALSVFTDDLATYQDLSRLYLQEVSDCMERLEDADMHKGTWAFITLINLYLSVFAAWASPSVVFERAV